MKKILVLSFSLFISFFILIYIFTSGMLHPKVFTLNNIDILSPRDSVLFDVSVNDITVQSIYSPLFLANINEFTIRNNDYISIIFLGLNGSLKNMLSIEASVRTETYFNKFNTVMQKKYFLTKVKSKVCKIYKYQETYTTNINEDKIIYHALLFHKDDNLFVTIRSDKKEIVKNAINDICRSKAVSDPHVTRGSPHPKANLR